jgi:hypothetical protein
LVLGAPAFPHMPMRTIVEVLTPAPQAKFPFLASGARFCISRDFSV